MKAAHARRVADLTSDAWDAQEGMKFKTLRGWRRPPRLPTLAAPTAGSDTCAVRLSTLQKRRPRFI